MKILAVSDIHNRSEQMGWILRTSQFCDLLLIAGDILVDGQGPEEVAWWLRSIRCSLALSTGDQDSRFGTADWLQGLRSPSKLIDEAGIICGIPVAALPWRWRQGDWYEQSQRLCSSAASHAQPWIMLAHSIGREAPTIQTAEFEESASARLCYTGHTPTPGWFGPWVNSGHTTFPIPNHTWVDWSTGNCALNLHHAGGMRQLRHSLTR